MRHKFASVFFFCSILLHFTSSCKREGCTDPNADNYTPKKKKVKHSTCQYTFIRDLSFETDKYWQTYPAKDASIHAKRSSVNNGFMPTDGESFLQCIPLVSQNSISYSTNTLQNYMGNDPFIGLYFDYRIVAIAGPDSVLKAYAWFMNNNRLGHSSWNKAINENASTFGGFPKIVIEKRNEYIDLNWANGGYINITSSVSAGTFTLEIDNIRLVRR